MTRWHKILHGFVADTTDEVIADASTSEQLKHYSHCTKVQYLYYRPYVNLIHSMEQQSRDSS